MSSIVISGRKVVEKNLKKHTHVVLKPVDNSSSLRSESKKKNRKTSKFSGQCQISIRRRARSICTDTISYVKRPKGGSDTFGQVDQSTFCYRKIQKNELYRRQKDVSD